MIIRKKKSQQVHVTVLNRIHWQKPLYIRKSIININESL